MKHAHPAKALDWISPDVAIDLVRQARGYVRDEAKIWAGLLKLLRRGQIRHRFASLLDSSPRLDTAAEAVEAPKGRTSALSGVELIDLLSFAAEGLPLPDGYSIIDAMPHEGDFEIEIDKATCRRVRASGLELCLPDVEAAIGASGKGGQLSDWALASPRGRPLKYDWERALAYVAAVANTIDGIRSGNQLSVDDVIGVLRGWFDRHYSESPSHLALRQRALLVVEEALNLKAANRKTRAPAKRASAQPKSFEKRETHA